MHFDKKKANDVVIFITYDFSFYYLLIVFYSKLTVYLLLAYIWFHLWVDLTNAVTEYYTCSTPKPLNHGSRR